MFHTRCTTWLGLGDRRPVAGLHLTAESATLVALRDRPLRITALGRQVVFDAAVVNDDDRMTRSLAGDVRSLASQLNLPPGTPAVAAIEPTASAISITHGGSGASTCDAGQRAYERLVEVVTLAGLLLVRVDPVPAALARLARLLGPGPDGAGAEVALRGPCRWSVLTSPDFTEAERRHRPHRPGLWSGPDFGSLQPVTDLPIEVPRNVRSGLLIDRDAVAIGAGLAGFDLDPLITVRPVADRPGAADWTLQRASGGC